MLSNIAILAAGALALPYTKVNLLKRDVASIPGFDYQNDKLRGVNVGGWFVLEPYMNPSFFNDGWDPANIPLDEYHWTQMKGKEQAAQILDNHWDTWIQESDFQEMASYGLNFARIPIGYWAFLELPGDPYVQGQLKYLDRAIEWARNSNIKVWVDLHGVPGSQNGFDNSGIRDIIDFQKGDNQENAVKAFQLLSERYGGPEYYDVVIGLEVVNEPLGSALDMNQLHGYCNQTYDLVRSQGEQGVIIHDAFQSVGYMNNWFNTPDAYNAVIDHHIYQVFSVPELNRTWDEHLQFTCDKGRQLSTWENKWRVVGEWSAALTDCAPLLNGVYRGARYDGSYQNNVPLGSCANINDPSQWSEERKVQQRKHIEAQLDAWEYGSSGWAIWAWKTENTLEWDVKALVAAGFFPNPVTDRQYPNQCGF